MEVTTTTDANRKVNAPRSRTPYSFIKRLFDLVFSISAVVVLSPVFIIIGITIKLSSRGPVLFAHKRVGKGGKVINVYKFRSMVSNAEALIADFTPEQMAEFKVSYKLKNDPRVTKVGHFLRRTSLDELPQLFNIIKGDLSLVGPRPVTQAETEEYGEDRDEFLSVRPGLTGYWAAYGRSEVAGKQRRDMELHYVRRRSLGFDIKILFKTVTAVIKGDGAI